MGETGTSITFYEQALALSREINECPITSLLLSNLCAVYATAGEAERALDYGQQSLVIAREIGDRPAEEAALANLELARAKVGRERSACPDTPAACGQDEPKP